MKVEWKSCFRIGITVALLYIFTQYWGSASEFVMRILGAATPILVGCIMGYILNILMSFYEKHYFPKSQKKIVTRSRRAVCMVAAMVTLVALIVLVIALVVPELVSCVQLLIAKVPEAMTHLAEWLNEMEILPENIEETLIAVDWEKRMEQIVKVFVSGIGNITDFLVGTVFSVVSGIVTFFVGFIFSIYLLSGKERLGNQLNRVMYHYMKKSWCDKIKYVLSVMDDSFHRYIVGQCTEAVILGVLCALGMAILKLPYASMIGALIAFTALIPVAGAYIGGGIGAFMILTVSPIKAVIFVIFLVVLQQIEGNLIYPRVVGSSMGLPAIWVLVAVTIGGGVMGIAGMLLGVPFAATLYRLIREDVNKPQPQTEPQTQTETKTKSKPQTQGKSRGKK